MRKILLVLFLLWNLSNPAWATNWCADANIVGCWNAEDGSGTTISDESSNNVDSVFRSTTSDPAWSSSVPVSGDGFLGTSTYSVNYDGNDGSIVSDNAVLDITSAFTVVLWYRTAGCSSNSGCWMFGRDTDTGRSYNFGIRQISNTRVMQSQINGTNYPDNIGDRDSIVEDNSWHHLAWAYNGTNILYYLDGVLDITVSGANPAATASNLYFGQRQYPSFEDYYTGYLDEQAIFNNLKSVTDINDIMDNGLVQATTARRRMMIIQ